MPAPTVIYRPSSGAGYAFEDKTLPVASKSEWGIDTLTRQLTGAQPGLIAYINALNVGDTTTYNGQTFYLQSWSDDKDQTYPTISLNYKGLFAGIPDPIISFTTLNQIITKVTTTTYGDITQIYSYTTRTITTRYISTTAPSVPTYTNVSTKFTPTIYKREYRTAAGDIFSPGVFEMIVLKTLVFKDPIKTESTTTTSCDQIVAGVDLYECQDVTTILFTGE
jgi:hypothetical protein